MKGTPQEYHTLNQSQITSTEAIKPSEDVLAAAATATGGEADN